MERWELGTPPGSAWAHEAGGRASRQGAADGDYYWVDGGGERERDVRDDAAEKRGRQRDRPDRQTDRATTTCRYSQSSRIVVVVATLVRASEVAQVRQVGKSVWRWTFLLPSHPPRTLPTPNLVPARACLSLSTCPACVLVSIQEEARPRWWRLELCSPAPGGQVGGDAFAAGTGTGMRG